MRLILSTHLKFHGDSGVKIPVVSNGSVTYKTKILSTSRVANKGKPEQMVIVLEQYFKLPDGRIRVTFPGGTEIITEREVSVVVEDLIHEVNIAADLNYEYYKDVVDRAVQARADKLGISKDKMQKRLEKDSRDLHGIPPELARSDFIPSELHLTCASGVPILGFCYLTTGYIGYNHDARILDWIKGKPFILQHEMVHCNPKLQKFPLEIFDFEFMASIPEMLYVENTNDLMHHSYAAVLRKMIWIHFGYDFKQARDEMIKFDFMGNLMIDENKYRENYETLQKAKNEMFRILHEKIIPEIYSDYFWWAAIHDRLNDNNAYMKIGMALYYDMTLLGGRQKTMEWLETHKEEIKQMADDAYNEMTEEEDEENSRYEEISKNLAIPRSILNRYKNALTLEQKEKISKFFRENPDELERVRGMIHSSRWIDLARYFNDMILHLRSEKNK